MNRSYFNCLSPISALVFFSVFSTCAHGRGALLCSDVKYAYNLKGFDDDVPPSAISGEHLRICKQGFTCCTERMEYKLSNHSRAEFDTLFRSFIVDLKNIFDVQTKQFDEFFRELLRVSRKDFHEMFLRTYGQLYAQNSYLFSSMFDELEKYYITGVVDLEETMDNFFRSLYRKMFPALNPTNHFTDIYLNCVEEYMDTMRPFGEVPSKLVVDIKRSFTATRTFVQALSVARDVIRSIMDVGLSPDCNRALMKMSYCPHCLGLMNLKPCNSYCLQVLNSCLVNHVEFGGEWNSFIDALVNLVSRLENSFNIESVLEPIDIKISEAIMHFQDNSAEISKKIFKICGKPRINKRDISKQEITLEKLKFVPQNTVRPTTAAGTSVDRLVQVLKKKMKQIKKYWQVLPAKLCNSKKVTDGTWSDSCWDGHDKSSGVVNATISLPNELLPTTPPQSSAIINQQMLTLKLITMKLSQAYKGLDVFWEDSSDIASGSGSGSGYGEDTMPGGYQDIFFSIPPPSSTPKVPSRPKYPKIHFPSAAHGLQLSKVTFVLILSLTSFKSLH